MATSPPYSIICATTQDRETFYAETPLGRSLSALAPLLANQCRVEIFENNQSGLSQVYNQGLARAQKKHASFAIFVHDDVRIDDGLLFTKLDQAFTRFDVVGVAGPRSLSVNTPIIGWGICPKEFQAGWITHPMYDRMDKGLYVDYYGPSPMPTVALDGLFMAARIDSVGLSPFDEQFSFDFYDLDFTLSQHLAGKNIGVWPIQLTHFSKGQGWRSERFTQMQELFRAKYGGKKRCWNLPRKWWVLRQILCHASRKHPPPQGEFTVSYRNLPEPDNESAR